MRPITFERVNAKNLDGRAVVAYYVRYDGDPMPHGPWRANTICRVLVDALREAQSLPDPELE